MLTSEAVKQRAREIGFDLCGVAPVGAFPELARLREWIDRGYAGTMAYLPRTAERRSDVRRVLPSAKSVIVTGTIYNSSHPYSTERTSTTKAEIARYACAEDYHDLLGARIESLVSWMHSVHPEPFDARGYVDTGPVQERVYAQYAGLGWIGKNTCLIHPEAGSWILLSEIICSVALEPDAPGTDQCGTCTLCLEACPTGAFVEPHLMDATKCISYLTIEYRGVVPEEHRAAIGNHVFGCDICQEVCPWNGPTVRRAGPFGLDRRDDLRDADLLDLSRKTDTELELLIEGTPLTRAGVRGLRRNVEIALENTGQIPPFTAEDAEVES